ncbi:hypothetical protein MUP05_05925 [Candidatus Bathyarchaeota archaeon]|jgi:hypothetical protein|nr:hypothetical protein [Candidatus Bathyarchaeota archaeon]
MSLRDSSQEQMNRPGILTRGVAGMLRALVTEHDPMTILSWVSGVGAIAVLLGSTVRSTPPYVFGDALVSAEVYVLPWIYMKPMTLFTFLFFMSYAFGLSSTSNRERFVRMPTRLRDTVNVLAWLFAMGSGFEIIYHVVLWSAALAVQGLQNPDIIVNPWPNNPYPINVVFSGKLVVLIFALSCFTISHLGRIEREKELEVLRNTQV